MERRHLHGKPQRGSDAVALCLQECDAELSVSEMVGECWPQRGAV